MKFENGGIKFFATYGMANAVDVKTNKNIWSALDVFTLPKYKKREPNEEEVLRLHNMFLLAEKEIKQKRSMGGIE